MNPISELPLGLGMALAQNPSAMESFTAMSEAERRQVIEHTHSIRSKQEMQAFVNSLPSGEGGETSFF